MTSITIFLCYVFNDIQYNGDGGGDYFTLLLEKFSGHSLAQRTFYSIEDIIDTKRLFCLWLLQYNNGSIYKLQRNSIGCLCVVAPSQPMKMNGCPLYSVVFFNWTLLNLFLGVAAVKYSAKTNNDTKTNDLQLWELHSNLCRQKYKRNSVA